MTPQERLEAARNEVLEAAKRYQNHDTGETHQRARAFFKSVDNLIAIEAELNDPVRAFVRMARHYNPYRTDDKSIQFQAPWPLGEYMEALEAAEKHLEKVR